ncbi:uncharacterized protein [Diadema antillarum]|uniref:uncharacterized protein n=1 Tax=Diadema antillarum TaxID=105358 RepID=UPI003A88F5CA
MDRAMFDSTFIAGGNKRRSAQISTPTGGSRSDYYCIGCYQEEFVRNDYRPDLSFASLSVDNCTAFCRESGYPFAGISNGTVCTCGCELKFFNHSRTLNSTDCGIPCPGDPERRCGGWGKALVYIATSPQPSTTRACYACNQTILSESCDYVKCVVFSAAVGSALTLVLSVVTTCCVRRWKRRPASQTNSWSATFPPHTADANRGSAVDSPSTHKTATLTSLGRIFSPRRKEAYALHDPAIKANPCESTEMQQHIYQSQIYATPNPAAEQVGEYATLPGSSCREAAPHLYMYDTVKGSDYECILSNEDDIEGEKCKSYPDLKEMEEEESNSPVVGNESCDTAS